jgi:hypothetical protein
MLDLLDEYRLITLRDGLGLVTFLINQPDGWNTDLHSGKANKPNGTTALDRAALVLGC